MSMTKLEQRCVDAYARASETTDYGTELNTLGIVRAVLAEAGVAELVAAVTEARDQFAEYAELHAAKGTEDGDIKASVNHAFACKMTRALAKIGANQ